MGSDKVLKLYQDSGALIHVPCASCGYDILGAATSCSECGEAISVSMDQRRLFFGKPIVLAVIRTAIGLWLLMPVMTFAMLLIWIALPYAPPASLQYAWIIATTVGALLSLIVLSWIYCARAGKLWRILIFGVVAGAGAMAGTANVESAAVILIGVAPSFSLGLPPYCAGLAGVISVCSLHLIILGILRGDASGRCKAGLYTASLVIAAMFVSYPILSRGTGIAFVVSFFALLCVGCGASMMGMGIAIVRVGQIRRQQVEFAERARTAK